ncbi:MAG: signal peptidase I [Patescibacteria group bacterium]|nr:signal peptidase I [Patescibacteria group bacterium]MDE2144608.1 signal peptidase I [Patescibacteria group bacterium]
MKKYLLDVWEILETLIIASVSILIIYKYIAQPFVVEGASMQPNFYSGDYLLVDEISYRFEHPERGQVIVFHNPQDTKEFYIKRIVGLPGDKVVIGNGTINVNGQQVNQSYLPSGMPTSGNETVVLGKDQYFVLGDNRVVSYDSRSWGPLNGNLIVGVVRLRFWPFNEFKVFTYPNATG